MKHIIILLITFLLVSCHTIKYVEVPIETVKTETITKILYDSITVHDSIDRLIKGDTCYIYKEKLIVKYKVLNDTIIKDNVIEKPIYVNKTVTKKINKLTLLQKMFMYLGVITFGGILILLAAFIRCRI